MHFLNMIVNALLQIMGFSWFLTTPAGLAMDLSIVWLRIYIVVSFS